MCDPVTATAVLTIVSSAVGTVGQIQSGKAQAKAINRQNEIASEEIANAAGIELTERARAARREHGALRAAGSAAGINLETSGSFLASLQTAAMNQGIDSGLVVYNERTRQRGRQAEANSAMARVYIPSALEAALTIGGTAVSAADKAKRAKDAASKRAAGGR